ncbi:hypothetical protein DC20_02555 [Rufibacter tibetensis]|uniref:Uncharacterized protein n=1 Tax=Rufibacter tibetensis TaxID=512763 RepID=A0A0P0C9G4_9BACT|nr:hypothetical protein DC20_02555 [Rufibacter tibetensis]
MLLSAIPVFSSSASLLAIDRQKLKEIDISGRKGSARGEDWNCGRERMEGSYETTKHMGLASIPHHVSKNKPITALFYPS